MLTIDRVSNSVNRYLFLIKDIELIIITTIQRKEETEVFMSKCWEWFQRNKIENVGKLTQLIDR